MTGVAQALRNLLRELATWHDANYLAEAVIIAEEEAHEALRQMAVEKGKGTFLICPVRGYEPTKWEAFVEELDRRGLEVHWPSRDTHQDDSIGLQICKDNRRAIRAVDMVHVIWDGKSTGVLFDLGMAFALGKKVVVIALPEATEGKSFQNMVKAWARESQQMTLGGD